MNSKLAAIWFKRPKNKTKRKPKHKGKVIVLNISAPNVLPTQSLVITGNRKRLGDWNPELSPMLDDSRFPVWRAELPVKDIEGEIEYKYCIVDTESRQLIEWEEGENRRLFIPDSLPEWTILDEDMPLRTRRLNPKVAGTAIPVFSLRTENSFGIGDFGDLLPFIDWLNLTDQHILQLLPLNDTTQTHTWRDSYPYNAISTNALHPIYLNLEKIGKLRKTSRREYYKNLQQELNALPEIDYEKVEHAKWEYFQEIFDQEFKKTQSSDDFQHFLFVNRKWIYTYATYCLLRDTYHTADFSQWKKYSTCNEQLNDKLLKKTTNYDQFKLHCFLQFHLHKQLTEAVEYAHSKGVAIKGDMPVGLSRNCVEAWTQPQLFNLDFQTGAPPDPFSKTGQNWGFPTYNWEKIAENDYEWLKNRFKTMAQYFDAYRIDHILGFFRIWEIPQPHKLGLMGIFSPSLPYSANEIKQTGPDIILDKQETGNQLFLPDPRQKDFFHPSINARETALYQSLSDYQRSIFDNIYDDYFYHRNENLWRETGRKRLEAAVAASDMLPCGEDLGMIPSCVPEVMHELQILSLEIERMPKRFGLDYTPLAELPYLSVCTTSTHDMDTLRLWWAEDFERSQKYYNQILKQTGEAPKDLTPEVCRMILENHLNSPSMLVIIPLQDYLALDKTHRRIDASAERINIPANPQHYWRYRMHLNINELIEAEELNGKIREMIEKRKK